MLMSDLVTEVIGEIGGDSDDTALAIRIFGYMKAGMRILPAIVRSRTITSRQSFVLPANNYSYNLALLSPSFIRERDSMAFSYVDPNGKEQGIVRLGSDEFKQSKDQGAQAYPKFFNIGNRTVYFDRAAPLALTINVDYFCGLTDNLISSSTFTLGEDQIELVKFLTKMVYYEYQEDDTKHDRNLAKAKTMWEELEARYIEDELGDFPAES